MFSGVRQKIINTIHDETQHRLSSCAWWYGVLLITISPIMGSSIAGTKQRSSDCHSTLYVCVCMCICSMYVLQSTNSTTIIKVFLNTSFFYY